MAVIPKPFREWKLGPPKANSRQRVLAEWRGIDLTPMEIARAHREKKAGDLLPKVLKEMGIDRRRSETEIVKVWNHLIDPVVTAHAQPTGIHKGTLFITVDSSVWLDEIVRYRRREILDRLRHSFGKDLISKVSFRVG